MNAYEDSAKQVSVSKATRIRERRLSLNDIDPHAIHGVATSSRGLLTHIAPRYILTILIIGMTLWSWGCNVIEDPIGPPAVDGGIPPPLIIEPGASEETSPEDPSTEWEFGELPPSEFDQDEPGDPSNLEPQAIPPPQVRVAPSNLEAFRKSITAPNQFRFGLRWVAAQGHLSYVIERRVRFQSLPAPEFQDVSTVSASATTADVVMSVSSLAIVEFRIRAVNGASTRLSNIASISPSQTFPAGFAFPAPTNLTATGVAVGAVRLDWNDNHHNEPSSIAYQIEKRGATAFEVIAKLPPNFTSFRVSGLSGFSGFRIRSVPTAGSSFTASAYSNEVIADVPIFAPGLAAPTDLRATVISSSEIKLEWNDNANNELTYVIAQGTSGANITDVATALGANPILSPTIVASYGATGLLPNTQYFFHVRAHNLNGDSPQSNTVQVSTLAAATLPAAPSQLEAIARSSSVIELAWRDNATNEEQFVIDRSTNGGQSFVEYFSEASAVFPRNPADPNQIVVTDDGIAANTQFCYRVRARNSAGPSAPSNTGCATTLVATQAAVQITNRSVYPVRSLLVNNVQRLQANSILSPNSATTITVPAGTANVVAQTAFFTAQGVFPMYNSTVTVSVSNGTIVDVLIENPSIGSLLTRFTNAPFTWEALSFRAGCGFCDTESCTFGPILAGQTVGQYQRAFNGGPFETGTYSLISYPGNGTVTFRLSTSGTIGTMQEVPDGGGIRHILMNGLDFQDD